MISVLYVDDERDLLEIAQLFLEQTGEFTIAVSQSANESLASPGIGKYDAIVSDYQMPDMDGIAFLKAIRAGFGDIPFILFTGRGREEVVIDAINNGADFYLQKGGDPAAQFAELSHKIRKAVERRRAEEELRAANEQLSAYSEELQAQYNDLVDSGKRIRESEAQLRAVFETSPYSIAINRASDGVYLAVNAAWEEYSGYRIEDSLGKNALDMGLVSDEERVRMERMLAEDGKIHRRIIRTRNRNGADRYSLISTSRIVYDKQPAYLSMLVDITELKHAEAVITRQKLQLEEIAAGMPGLVYQYYARNDGTTGLYYFNEQAARKYFGFDGPTADPLGWFAERIHPDDRERFRQSNAAAMAGRTEWIFEGRFIRPDGEVIWFQGRSSPAVHKNEVVFSGILLDITRQKTTDSQKRS